MKILYVEDEVLTNLPHIMRLFGKYLDWEKIERLELLKQENSNNQDLPEKIKNIIEESGVIDFEYRFPNALRKVIQNHENYALFIVDRNLAENEYYPEEVSRIDRNYSHVQYDDYFEREGDYLFGKLMILSGTMNAAKKFYYLTSSSDDQYRSHSREIVKAAAGFKAFETEHFIRKDQNKNFEKLHNIVDKIKFLDLQTENINYLKILESRVGEKAGRSFLYLLSAKDSDEHEAIADNLENIGFLLEKILAVAAKRLQAPSACWDSGNRLIVRNFIWRLTRDSVTPKIKYKFDTNALLGNFFYSIYGICLDFGPRKSEKDRPSGYQPTANSVNALVYALKDIILWLDDICQKY